MYTDEKDTGASVYGSILAYSFDWNDDELAAALRHSNSG